MIKVFFYAKIQSKISPNNVLFLLAQRIRQEQINFQQKKNKTKIKIRLKN